MNWFYAGTCCWRPRRIGCNINGDWWCWFMQQEAQSNSVTALNIFPLKDVIVCWPDLSPEQSRRCRGQNVAAVERPRQEADSAPSYTLKRHAALRSNIPHLKPMASLQPVRHLGSQTTQFRWQLCSPTIMAVSIGDADTRSEPLGDQAMEVTGEWPGCERTWAQPEEGLPGWRRGNANQCEQLHLWWVLILASV